MRKALWALLSANIALASACTDDQPDPTFPATPVTPTTSQPREHEIRGGRVHDLVLAGVTDVDTMDPSPLIAAVQADLRGRLGALPTTAFAELSRETTRAGGNARLAHVTMRQTVNGIPVDETYLNIAVRYGQTDARIVSSSFRLYDNVHVDTSATVPHDRAVLFGRGALRLRGNTAPSSDELVIHKIDGRLELAWSLTFPGSHSRALVIASGQRQGQVATIDGRVYETTGNVSGTIVAGGAPGGLGTPIVSAVPRVTVTGTSGSVAADAGGNYAITVPNGSTLTASLSGSASVVHDSVSPLTASGAAVDGGTTDLSLPATSENQLAQATAYYYVDYTRAFGEANGLEPAVLGAPLDTNTNLNEFCNAYFSPFDRSINFFASGGGCNNSAIDTVIAHEYGHFVDEAYGGIIDGGLSEGWGDLLACLAFGVAPVGFDLFPGTAIRSCQNDYVYPPGGFDEVHNLGQAWAGFGWDVREGLRAELGDVAGEQLARELLLPSFNSNSPDIPTSVRETFLRDDDDGNLDNETPHWAVLYAAALHHGLVFAIDPDLIPPGDVTDLTVTDAQATQVTVAFTAPGDDGIDGTAANYDLRYATFPIDASNFGGATPVPTSAPLPAGSLETITFGAPPETTLYFALVTYDEQFNVSQLSNVASVTTPTGTIIWEDGAEGDTSGWTPDGLWHVTERRASEGTHSFWYGLEATGNYNTGTANAGTLTSPIIDLSGAVGPVLVLDQFVNVEYDPYDTTTIIVTNVDDPTEQVAFGKDTPYTGEVFVPRVLPLNGFDGDRIQVTFAFDTLDDLYNDTEGWYLDHIRVIGSDSCAHGLCFTGPALDPTCSECVATVCSFDSYCCTTFWDGICVQEAQDTCGTVCTTCGNGACEAGEDPTNCPQDCQPECAHELCEPGEALDPTCDSCAATVCAADDFCCGTFWDRICVQEVTDLCGITCEGCTHDQCAVGEALAADCDTCTTDVCSFDSYCCTNAWDSRCVAEAADVCGLSCNVCSHSPCDQGQQLEPSCDPCVDAVCAADPFCCSGTWDERCVEEAGNTCGLACETFR